jgi:protein TonB
MHVEFHNHDRLLVALFIASLVHAVLILGLSFEFPKPQRVEKSLDIVLVKTPSAQAPDKADYLAPEHQLGSGQGKEKAVPRTAPAPQQGLGQDLRKPSPVEQKPVPVAKATPKPRLTQAASEKKVAAEAGDDEPVETERPHLDAASLSQQIAELTAELNLSQQDQAKQPKVVYINAVSAHKHKAAAYEAAWQQKVERIGNLNYPDEARRKNLSGNLTLAVGLNPDGSVYSIKVLESSGERVLDEAAQRIVRLAAPFAPFPEELKQEADVLVITRTWRFFVGHRMETGR